MRKVDVLVIGAGAAGLMAAAAAGRRGLKALVLEHTDTIGAKILISGGGRCNFTNLDVRPDRFLSANPHFARSALSRYTQADFIDLVRAHRIEFYEKTLGQLFCEGAGSAKRIVAMLMAECAAAHAEVRTNVGITRITRAETFSVSTSEGGIEARALVVATGGLSIPKLGATAFAYDLARHFGVPIIAPRPALVPLVFGHEDLTWMRPLAGVSVEALARCGKGVFREGMLFTHRGLSGPSILQVSSYRHDRTDTVEIDLSPERDPAAHLLSAKTARPKARPLSVLSELLPQRLAEAWIARSPEAAALDRPMADQKDKTLQALADSLRRWRLKPVGDEGWAKAEVTAGGIDTKALDQRTMMAKAVPGLHFIGECVDVTGWLGGYNFQWAWSSGMAAGRETLPDIAQVAA